MKLLLDENWSPRLIPSINDLYPDTAHVEGCGLLSALDDQIWRFAFDSGFAIVTKDSDFSERSILSGCPPKVIWLRTGNCTSGRAGIVLRDRLEQIQEFLNSEQECCLVISVLSAH